MQRSLLRVKSASGVASAAVVSHWWSFFFSFLETKRESSLSGKKKKEKKRKEKKCKLSLYKDIYISYITYSLSYLDYKMDF